MKNSLDKPAAIAQPRAAHNGHSSNGHHLNGTTPPIPILLPQHRALIEASAIAPEVAEARGYQSISDPQRLAALGFAASQCITPALLIPVRNAAGDVLTHQSRPDAPRVDAKGKALKYETPARSKLAIDVPPGARSDIGDPSVPLYITEGARKADSAVSRGLCCIALLGVWNWRGTNAQGGLTALPDWESIAFKGRDAAGRAVARKVYIVFDSDVTEKDGVQKSLARLKPFLENRAARVKVIYLPAAPDGEKVGLDDFFAGGGTVEELLSHASSELRAAPAKMPELEALNISSFALNDIGNGQRFAAQHAAHLRFCSVWDKWAIFSGGCWQPDEHGAAEERAKQTSLEIAVEAAREADDDKRARLLKHAATLTKRAARETMLKDAASVPGMSITPEQFDTDLHLFNVANGTLHLPLRELRPHNPDDLLTHQSPVRFDSGAQCPIWRACMERWIPDEETRRYLQKLVGVSLSGKVFEELFVFLYGDGDNGKSTFLRVLERLCGSYWHKTQAETIMQAKDRRKAEAPSPDLLALKGARLVTVHEIDSKHHLNAALIKDLTGRDSITARGLFEKRGTTFEPQFTLWMFGNSKPKIEDQSGGMWRRPRLIPFGQPIPKNERDPQLSDKLQAEMSGILNWALDGLRDAYDTGLAVPDAVQKAVNEYRAEQDALQDFLNDCCIVGENCTAAAGDLWSEWERWSRDNGEKIGTQRAFGGELTRRKFERYQGNGHKRWRGIGLLSNQKATTPTTPTTENPRKFPIENSYAKTFSENGVVGVVGVVADSTDEDLGDDVFDDVSE